MHFALVGRRGPFTIYEIHTKLFFWFLVEGEVASIEIQDICLLL